ncbi:MAG: hypothetical protein KGI67_07485 [Pseudomonadota bacterium]|nr:hypothetical protein [Pseudomonadota bacterium]
MVRQILIVLASTAALSASAADVGLSLNIFQPGFFGQLGIGAMPPPVVYAQPVYAQPVYAAPVVVQPSYYAPGYYAPAPGYYVANGGYGYGYGYGHGHHGHGGEHGHGHGHHHDD